MTRLHPVPETAPRALGMIRVSKERDGMMAPEVQRIAIEDYARARGYQIVGWVEGIDEPGSRARSAWWPRLDEAIGQVEAGHVDVLVTWKFSRAARNRLKWAVAIDRVETAGGRLESATEQVDTTTSTGRFTRGMLAELNAFESERIGEVWKEVHAKRLAEGWTPTGKPRFGYVWDADQKVHVPDPDTGPVLVELYRRYVSGQSFYSLVRWLGETNIRTTAGALFTDRALRRVMDAGFAAGIIRWQGQQHPGRHDRLIDDDLWQQYLDVRADRRTTPPRTARSSYLLSGMVRCARCGGSMVANNPNDGVRAPSFRCRQAKEHGPGVCAGGYVAMWIVEEHVLAWLRTVADDVDEARRQEDVSVAQQVTAAAEVRRLLRRVEEIERSKSNLVKLVGEGVVPREDYLGAAREYDEEREKLVRRIDDHGREMRRDRRGRQALARTLLERWPALPVEVRRATLKDLIREVQVLTGPRTGSDSVAVVDIIHN